MSHTTAPITDSYAKATRERMRFLAAKYVHSRRVGDRLAITAQMLTSVSSTAVEAFLEEAFEEADR